MSVAMLTLILLGAGAPDASGRPIGYEVRVHEMEGLAWRSVLHPRMTAIARPGSATVWVAPKDLASEVAAQSARTIYAPKPVREGGLSGSVRQTLKRPYVADVSRVADGPVNHSSALAFKPAIDYWEETLSVAVQCQKVETGVLTAVDIDESRLISLVSYAVSEDVQPKDPKGGAKSARLNAQVQVPEVAADRVEGEWLIPHEHALIVSLGVHTVQKEGGKSVVTERVAVITPDGDCVLEPSRPTPSSPAPADPSMTLAGTSPTSQGQEPLPPLPIGESGRWVTANRAIDARQATLAGTGPIVISTPAQGAIIIIVQGPGQMETLTNLALNAPSAVPAATTVTVPPPAPAAAPAAVPTMPGLPSRSLPTPRNAQGDVVPLPPLPPDSEQALEPSTEPRGTPQTLKPPPPAASDDSSEPKSSGPGAVSHAPTYHAQGRKLSVTGIYRDGHGWTAKSNGVESSPAGSVGLNVRFQIRSCGSDEGELSAADQALGKLVRVLEDVSPASRLTTSLGIDAEGNRVRTSIFDAAICPEMPRPLGSEIVPEAADVPGCFPGGFAALEATRVRIGERLRLRSVRNGMLGSSAVGAGAAAALLADVATQAPASDARDGAVVRASDTARRDQKPRHSIGLVLGAGAAVQPGRLPGSSVIRIPLGGVFSILYRDDMAFETPVSTRK